MTSPAFAEFTQTPSYCGNVLTYNVFYSPALPVPSISVLNNASRTFTYDGNDAFCAGTYYVSVGAVD